MSALKTHAGSPTDRIPLLEHVSLLVRELDIKTDELEASETKLRQAADAGNALLYQLSVQRFTDRQICRHY